MGWIIKIVVCLGHKRLSCSFHQIPLTSLVWRTPIHTELFSCLERQQLRIGSGICKCRLLKDFAFLGTDLQNVILWQRSPWKVSPLHCRHQPNAFRVKKAIFVASAKTSLRHNAFSLRVQVKRPGNKQWFISPALNNLDTHLEKQIISVLQVKLKYNMVILSGLSLITNHDATDCDLHPLSVTDMWPVSTCREVTTDVVCLN